MIWAWILAVVLIAVILLLASGRVQIKRGGIALRRKSFVLEDGTKVWISDELCVRPLARSRALATRGGYYSRIPLSGNRLYLFRYCEELLLLLGETPIRRTLTLGGAGGGLPLYLANAYPEAKHDIVEISGICIEICKRYFIPRELFENGRISLLHADASVAVRGLTAPYQLIFCDVFNGGTPSGILSDTTFMQSLSRLVGEEGILVLNGTGHTGVTLRPIVAQLEVAFGAIQVFLRGQKFVLVATNRKDFDAEKIPRHYEQYIPVYPVSLGK